MNAVKCDNCVKVTSTEGLVGWFKLEDVSVTRGYDDFERHFCSWHCIAEYADQRDQVAT